MWKKYSYKRVSGRKPRGPHTLVEYGNTIYMISSANDISYSTDEGENWSTIAEPVGVAGDIISIFLDRGAERLYTLHDNTTHIFTCYVDLTDNSITELDDWDVSAGYVNFYCYDMIVVAGEAYISFSARDGAVSQQMGFYTVSDNSEDRINTGVSVATNDLSRMTAVGTTIYTLYQRDTDDVDLYSYVPGTSTIVKIEDCGAGTDIPIENQKAIAYDGTDFLYYVLLVGGSYFFYSYSISGDVQVKGAEFDVCLMLNRNTMTNVLEKAFHKTEYYAYQIHRSYNSLLKIGDLNNSDTIATDIVIGITDNFLFTDDSQLYKLEDDSDKVDIKIINRVGYPPEAYLTTDDYISAGFTFRVHQEYLMNPSSNVLRNNDWDEVTDGTSTITYTKDSTLKMNVVNMNDNDVNQLEIDQIYTDTSESYVSFYMKSSDPTNLNQVYIADGDPNVSIYNVVAAFRFINDDLDAISGGATWVELDGAVVADQWYHIEVLFLWDDDKYEVWLDGVYKVTNDMFTNTHTSVNWFYAKTNSTPQDYVVSIARVYFGEDHDAWLDETIIFEGYTKDYEFDGTQRVYHAVSAIDNELNRQHTGTYSEDLSDIFEDVIDAEGDFLYYDTITNLGVSIDYDPEEATVKEIFNDIGDRGDAVWYLEPDGRAQLRDSTDLIDTEIVLQQASPDYGFTLQTVRKISNVINSVVLYGAGFITSTAEDEDSIRINGRKEIVKYYPAISDQSELDDMADAILTGVKSAVRLSIVMLDIGFLQVGETMNFVYPLYEELAVAADYLIEKVEIEDGVIMLNLTDGIIQSPARVDQQTEKNTELIAGNSSRIDTIAAGGMANLIEDTTPQLGGDLDMNGYSLTDETFNGVRIGNCIWMNTGCSLVEIQTAVTDLNTTGGTIYLPVGSWDITTQWAMGSHIKMVGSGSTKTIFNCKVSGDYAILVTSNCDISYIKLNISYTSGMNGLEISSTNNNIHDIYVYDSTHNHRGIVVNGGGEWNLIHHCLLYSCDYGVVMYSDFNNVTDCMFRDCDCGMYLGHTCQCCAIIGNKFYSSNLRNIYLSSADYCVVIGNTSSGATATILDTGSGNSIGYNPAM